MGATCMDDEAKAVWATIALMILGAGCVVGYHELKQPKETPPVTASEVEELDAEADPPPAQPDSK